MTSKQLRELLEKHEHFTTELAKMRADDERAKATEARILEDGRIDDNEIKSLTNARTARELIARRIPTVEETLRRLDQQIETELLACASRYNRAVRTAVESKVEQIIAKNREDWEGNLRGLKKWVETATIPAVREIRKAHFDFGFSGSPGLDFFANQARSFLERSARGVKAFNLTTT